VRVSVIVTTYNHPDQLEKVLWGYAAQRLKDFEVVVADDGSRVDTTETIDRVAADSGLDVVHVRHADEGFRKTLILNRAIVASTGDYLIFTDGDCIPRDDFVELHVQCAEPGAFLSGGYLKLPEELSRNLTNEDIRSGRVMEAEWLEQRGWHAGRHAFRLIRSKLVAGLLDALTPTRRTWNGHNSSTWRDAIIAANGFDLDLRYGGLDRAMGVRLRNAGLKGKQIRYRAPCLHLYHERPYLDMAQWKRNKEFCRRLRREGVTSAAHGIAQLEPDESLVIRRIEQAAQSDALPYDNRWLTHR
jgi:glycosyltransferase involved in cell wall biosynthesis